MKFIDANRGAFGVEPICRELQVAPSTYYSAKSRLPSARAVRDVVLEALIVAVWSLNFEVYGVRKVWKSLLRQGETVGRDQVARLMRELGIRGVVRGKERRTTRRNPDHARAPDLVKRNFTAEGPDQLWVCDFTYVATWAGVVYVAFIVDVSRFIVGWRAATTMTSQLVIDALNMAAWQRGSRFDGLVAHSDAGSQYTSIAYTERLAEIGAAPSIGTVRDSYDNSMAESTIGLYKTELVKKNKPWRDCDQVELATLTYVEWFNHHRPGSEIGDIPPAELDAACYRQQDTNETIGIQ